MFEMDSQEQIVLAKTYEKMGKCLRKAIGERNGYGRIILECSGLGELVEEFKDALTPVRYNEQWENDNVSYNPVEACFKICRKIESNKQALGCFLKEIFSRVREIDEDDFQELKNYMEIIGYDLTHSEKKDEYGYSEHKYNLSPLSTGSHERQEDKSHLLLALNQNHSDILPHYLEAISTYGNSEYKSCVNNCRTLFEKFFKKFDTVNSSDYAKGILEVTGEKIIESGEEKTSINKIFRHWIEKHEGANRYRLFVTLYSAMSGLATHGEEVTTKEDALMCLRLTEDVLIWCMQHGVLNLHSF
jgi:hypothetical protein